MRRATAARLACGAAALVCALEVRAAGQFIEDIQVSKRADEATITVQLACPMRFASDARTSQGVLLEVRVTPLDSCRQLGLDGLTSELYRPVAGRLAALTEVEYESLGVGDHLLLFHFDRAVDYRVTQRGDLRSLQLIVRLPEAPGAPSVTAAPEAPAPAAPAAVPQSPPPAPARAADAGRPPIAPRVREPRSTPDFVINLESRRERFTPDTIAALAVPPGRKPYVSEGVVDGEKWYRLRIGFFASEQEARAAAEPLAATYPRAWVGRAEPSEVELASGFGFAPGALVAAPQEAEQPLATLAAPVTAPGTLAPERVTELMKEGRDALLDRNYEAAVRVYTRLLQEPGDHRSEAREYLGLARERAGQLAHARAEYQAYLDEYPSGDGAQRVRQRLNGLALLGEQPRAPLRKDDSREKSRWSVATGLSQYYRRDIDQFDEDLPRVVSLEALFTDIDLNVRHAGEKLDVVGRVSASNLHDLVGEDRVSSVFNKPNRVSYAYVDVNRPVGDWTLRVGRQTLHNWGVLGRFDGVHFAYDWAPERRVHFTSGYPVESTRNGVETARRFYGAAVDFDHLVGLWDFSTFVQAQTIEGVTDRQATGFEAHYLDDKRSLTSLVDYDYGYGELNMALVLGTWQLPKRLTLTGLVDKRESPILTTRNALIGQPVATIDELLLVLTEDEIRDVARDRTAASTTVTLGLAKPLFERFQINADVTGTEIGATVESFGVPAFPSTGRQVYYSTSIVGSGLFGEGDVSIFNLRHGVADDFTTSQLTWDARFPVGRRVRLNPRLRLAVWESTDGRRRETTSPSFRLLVNGRHYRLELEGGSDEFLRTDLTSRQDSTGNYVNIGYRADF